ncbi:Ldh family oxidoreductase [Sinorhizobium psoraleae]|uniref:Ldh family oxidoreductase n=1 Tax=Sinorhizobium psoraleae TaxID=520838 RepID=A0ABT4KA83_9HYPH|nr:Ldh family oxidoreductase [Sinorhizobium psoraleae]MCZ4088796.1 Ldh family oxidoreductase [Sinorhizobium psoraleae]
MKIVNVETVRADIIRLLKATGLREDLAGDMTHIMIESDLMGHRTHGLAMLPTYLDRLGKDLIRKDGDITVVRETASTLNWQAHRLPGAYVVRRAICALYEKITSEPVITASIANCSHIGSLQAYLEEPARRGYLCLMMVTDPGVASVAPFGGRDPVLTSNPIAAAIPTHGDPILIDQCTSLVSNAQVQSADRSKPLPGRWVVDNAGRPTDDPNALTADPPGTIMPLGGEDFGYKGFGFGIMVEAFALALSGHGRLIPKQRGAQGVFLQLIDPAAFSGRDAFLAETTDFVRRCKASRPAEGAKGIRLPGERAMSEKRRQLHGGLEMPDELLERLAALASSHGVEAFADVRLSA